MKKWLSCSFCFLFAVTFPFNVHAHHIQGDTTVTNILSYNIPETQKADLLFSFALKHKISFPAESLKALDLAAAIQKQNDSTKQLADIQTLKAQILAQKGLYVPAILDFLEAYTYFDNAGLIGSKAWLLVNIGNIYYDLKQYNTAKMFYSKAAVLFEKTEEYFGWSVCMLNFGLINEQQNKLNDALNYFFESKKIRSKLFDPYLIAHINFYIARVYVNTGKYEEAEKFLFESNEIIRSSNYVFDEITQQICKNYLLLAALYEAQENTNKALLYADTALITAQSNFDTLSIINALIFKGNTFLQINKHDEVIANYNKALSFAEQSDNHEQKNRIFLLHIRHSLKHNDIAHALDYIDRYEETLRNNVQNELKQKNEALTLAVSSFYSNMELDKAKDIEEYNTFVIQLLGVFFIVLLTITIIFFNIKNRLWKSNKEILDSSFDGIILHQNGIIYDINTSFRNFTGYSMADLKNKSVFDIFEPDSHTEIKKNISLNLKAFYKTKLLLKSNTWSSVELDAKPIVYRGKKMRLVTIKDVSERQKTEAQILLFRTIIEQSFSSIVITDSNACIEYVNPGFLKLTGYNPEEVMGKNPKILKSGHHSSEFYKDMWDTLSKGNPWLGNIRNKDKNGKLFWEETIITPIIDSEGKIFKYAAIKRDITNRKQLEDNIKLLNNQLKMVFESIDAFVFVLDIKTELILFTNAATVASFGYTTNKHINDVVFNEETRHFLNIPKNDLLKHRNSTKSEDSSHTKEVFLKTTGRWYEFTSRVITWVNKENAILLMAYDITDRKNTIKLLNELNATKDKFFSIIAHDLRNPFQGLLGFTELLLGMPDYNDSKMVKMLLSNIEGASKNAYTLLENLLQWANLQRGTVKINKTAFSLNSVVDEAIAHTLTFAQNKNITLLNKMDTSVQVFADAQACSTILNNLLNNAVKFTPDNGLITVNALVNETTVEITVSDTGIGIPQEMLPALFRIDTKYSILGTRGEKGTGLGLILCKELVELNSGNIYVESQFKKGTTFTFTLPKPSPNEAVSKVKFL